jgi:hypothetical protein
LVLPGKKKTDAWFPHKAPGNGGEFAGVVQTIEAWLFFFLIRESTIYI